MRVKSFIEKFINITNIPGTAREIVQASVSKSVELIETNDDPLDDKYAEALWACADDEQAMIELVEENPDYYIFFIYGMMEVLGERLDIIDLNGEQKQELNQLLDKISWMEEWDQQ